MNTKLVNTAAGVINAALAQDRTAAGIALALESAQLLMTPETAAELEQLRTDRGRYRIAWRMAYQRAQGRGWAADRAGARAREGQEALQTMLFTVIVAQIACRAARLESEGSRARVADLEGKLAEYERPVDEDPIAYALTEQAEDEVFVPRTERQRWQDIADALNAAHAAGMPVGIDLDGTLTDRRMWSVVWDREGERWTVGGYETDDEQVLEECDHLNGHGPNGCAVCGAFRPADAEDDVTPQVKKLRDLLAGQHEQAGGAS